ncbi:CIA30 family protein [Roseobacteraceae bacterium S113]
MTRTALALMLFMTPAFANMTDDFADPTPWRYVADGVMGGVSEGQAQLIQTDRGPAMQLTGQVSTQNNGGFIQVRRDVPPQPTGTDALTLTVRGNGATYTIFLRTTRATRPWHSYRAQFVAGPEWQDITLPFSAFSAQGRPLPDEIAPAEIRSIGIAAYGAEFEADLTVSEIGFAQSE